MAKQEDGIFHTISLDDQNWMREKLQEEDVQACEYTFANNFIWRKVYQVEAAKIAGCGVIRFQEQGQYWYSFPFGNGDKKAAIDCLRELCHAEKSTLCMSPLVKKQRDWLLKEFPGEFELEAERDSFDYIYTTEKLSTLKGKKLHGKRNHIARFKDEDDWEYERLAPENRQECRLMAKEWSTLREEKWNEEMEAELHVLEEALSHMEELSLVGGILRKAGKIVAFTIGEPLNSDTFVVHFEKAYPSLQGAYPMINQQFVLHECQEFAYVNREEDTGDLGLRKAKLSYYPDILLEKYRAVESRVVFASEWEEEEVKKLWETCFGDEEEYIRLYFEHRFRKDNMMVIFKDGKPVSMASFLPVQLFKNGAYRPARYVYAVATLPEYRRRGYAAELIRHAAEKYQEPLLLQPAEESLKEYYRRLGFFDYFKAYRSEIPIASGEQQPSAGLLTACERKSAPALAEEQPAPGLLTACESLSAPALAEEQPSAGLLEACESLSAPALEEEHPDAGLLTACESLSVFDRLPDTAAGWTLGAITPEEYLALRDAHFEKEGYVRWDLEAIRYAIYENNFCAGAAVLLERAEDEEKIAENVEASKPKRRELFLCRVEGTTLRVVESTLSEEELEEFSSSLGEALRLKRVCIENAGGMMREPVQSQAAGGVMREPVQSQAVGGVMREPGAAHFPAGYLNLTLG